MRELPQLVAPGDLLVFNDTKRDSRAPVRAQGIRRQGGAAARAAARRRSWRWCMRAPARRCGPPWRCRAAAAPSRIVEKRGDLWVVELPEAALAFFERYGQMPLPPYIRREPDAADSTRYQSVFARKHGAVAAPTASLHFDDALLAALDARGVQTRVRHAARGRGHVPARAHRRGRRARHARGVRRSERRRPARRSRPRARAAGASSRWARPWCARSRAPRAAARSRPIVGDSSLFIVPGFRFRVVDAMVTNFHLPESTLLMLVSAFAGREAVLAAYRHAVARAVPVFQLW